MGMSKEALWDRRYSAKDRVFPTEPDETLVEFAGRITPGRAVDLGAGEGRNALWLAGRGWDVTAVDISGVALARLREIAAAEGLRVTSIQTEMAGFLKRGERFDLVVLAYMHPLPADRPALLAAAAAAVAPGGHLFLIGHHCDCLGEAGPHNPEQLYTEESLRAAFTGLDILQLKRREHRRARDSTLLADVVLWASAPAAGAAP